MTEYTRRFIELGIELIEAGEFDKLYRGNVDVPDFTGALLQAGIDPLKNMTHIPDNYLAERDIKEFTVPSHITRIGNGAFWSCENLNKVVLPEGLVYIDESAFSECHNLYQINFPTSLEYIQQDAFAETNLRHAVIPDLVTGIPRNCFENCEQLETVKLGKFCYRIGERAFAECDKLYYIQLNTGLEEIGSYAFSECYALREIHIPESVRKISQSAFYKIQNRIKVVCVENSYAHKWCEQNDQEYELV